MGKANKVTDRCQHIRNSYGFWLLRNILWRKRFGRIAVERESAQKFPLFLRIFLNNGFGRVVDSIYIIRSLSFLFSLKKSNRFHSFEISFFWSFSTVAHSICMHSGIHLTILKDKEKTTTRHDKKGVHKNELGKFKQERNCWWTYQVSSYVTKAIFHVLGLSTHIHTSIHSSAQTQHQVIVWLTRSLKSLHERATSYDQWTRLKVLNIQYAKFI